MSDGSRNIELTRNVPGRRRRRDAEANRDRVLAAARRLHRRHGVGGMTMDALATEAGVGKGTLYRGFGNRAGLAAALLDATERDLQERILTGPPPLGWGAEVEPADRLRAFVDAYLDLLATDADLVVETERGAPGTRFHIGAYGFWHAHIAALLRQQAHPSPTTRADVILSALSAELYLHLCAQGATHPDIAEAILC